MDDFRKALESSQTQPSLPEELEQSLPDLFKGEGNSDPLFRKVEPGEPNKIPWGNDYKLEFNCARLLIGKRELGVDPIGTPVTEDVDESGRLKEIMDMQMRAEAIILKKSETFLKDGTVVLWLEWATPKELPAKKDRDYLTQEEILSPEPSKSNEDSGDEV